LQIISDLLTTGESSPFMEDPEVGNSTHRAMPSLHSWTLSELLQNRALFMEDTAVGTATPRAMPILHSWTLSEILGYWPDQKFWFSWFLEPLSRPSFLEAIKNISNCNTFNTVLEIVKSNSKVNN